MAFKSFNSVLKKYGRWFLKMRVDPALRWLSSGANHNMVFQRHTARGPNKADLTLLRKHEGQYGTQATRSIQQFSCISKLKIPHPLLSVSQLATNTA